MSIWILPTAISIESDVSRESVVEFLAACQRKPFSISIDTAHDIVCLCDEWGTEALRSRVLEWISANETDLLVSTLLLDLKHGSDTSLIESRIRTNFDSLFDAEKLMELPLNVLCRIIDLESRFIFDFLMKCLSHFGSPASILFRDLDASRLSLEQFDRLERHNRFVWSFLGDMKSKSICSIVSECRIQDRKIEKLIEENQRLHSEISHLNCDLVSSHERFESQLASERARII
jgi:hypothetical protein